MDVLAPINLANNEIQNAKIQNLGTDPAGLGPGNTARFWFNTVSGKAKVWNGTTAELMTNVIESIATTGPVTASLLGKEVTIGVQATNANNPNTLVQRDASGNFSAGTITAALAGLAANSTLLAGQTLSQVRDFAQTTGTRTSTAISDFDTQVRTSRLDQMAAPTATVSMGNQRISNVTDPSSPQDVATKAYADSIASGLDVKASVRASTGSALPSNTYANGASGVGATLTATGNGALVSIDGVTLVVGNRLLVRNETTTANNGIYTVTQVGDAGTPYILTRAADANTGTKLNPGAFTFVEEGTARAASGWTLSTTGAVTIGTTAITWVQFSSSGAYTAGNGLSLAGSAFSVVGTSNRISVSGAGVDIAATYVGQTSLTTLGTIATGTWQGTAVAIGFGGTGASTAGGARTALGAVGKAAIDIPAGTSYAFVHNLGSTDVVVSVKEVSSKAMVYPDIVVTDANTVTVTFGAAVAASAYRVTVAA